MSDNGRFEKLEHTVPGVGILVVPFYVSETGDVAPESEILLEAVRIIGSQLGGVTLSDLVERVGQVVAHPAEKQGLIIEDEEGVGAIRVDAGTAIISVRRRGRVAVSSSLFFDMLYMWNTYQTEGEGESG
jgi:hypothetical protein